MPQTLPRLIAFLIGLVVLKLPSLAAAVEKEPATKFRVTVDRGEDIGQSFGSLFEVKSADGSLVIGAGFQNLFNTRYRADRHAVQFFVRPTDGRRSQSVSPTPRPNDLCGTYLTGRDEIVRSTYGGLKAYDPATNVWKEEPAGGGLHESMRVGDGLLEFGDSTAKYEGKTILPAPSRGSYQIFFYANGHLCFYHVNRGEGPYRAFVNDADGYSKLYACPWTPSQGEVDLSKAIVLTLPVVGETTFAWGQLGRQIVTGSNIGGFYVFEGGKWRMLLEPNIKVSYQLYSTMALHDRLVMGQYPTGRLFEYDGKSIVDRTDWPLQLEGVSRSAREAQTTVIYGGEMLVGIWPWGELWRYSPDTRKWTFLQRMFDHPSISDKVVHPYDVENQKGEVPNQWGQRVTSLVTSGPELFISTSSKDPRTWDPDKFPFLAPEKWKSYGAVYRMTTTGHLGAATKWTKGPTVFEFELRGNRMAISQDGRRIAETTLSAPLAEKFRLKPALQDVQWGHGIYGKFAGTSIQGEVAE
ncbi:MAG: hypothetical protein IT428_24800 [Planctomycetaceae bacterium]|nr:hypothetical protein [Planctomycetaceae bacterium]